MFTCQLLVIWLLLILSKVSISKPLLNSLSEKGEKQLAVDMLQSLPPVSIGQYNCSDVNPPNHSCHWVKQEGLCEVIRTQFCSLTCFTCCVDVAPPIYSCEVVVYLGICDHTITKGYCLRQCNACWRLREIFALTSLKLSIQIPNQLSTWVGWDICVSWSWSGVICKDGYVSELRLGLYYFNFQTKKWIQTRPSILSQVATSIPEQLSGLEHLNGLYLGYTGITGKLPAQLSVLYQLRGFDCSAGFVAGLLPLQYSAWTNSVVFNVNYNQIVGSIPKQFSMWRLMFSFQVNYNQLTGSIPMQLSTWLKIKAFYACSNKGNKLCTPNSFNEFSTGCPTC